MRVALVLPLLLVSLLVCGCLFSSQVVIGPTVDERGDVGGMVRVRVTAGLSRVSVMATGEISGRQASPHGLFATGVGLFSQVELPSDYVLIGNLLMVVIGSNDLGRGAGYSFGGALGFARYLRTKDEIIPKHLWQGWAVGAELACDRQFGLGSQDMVLAPGFVFEYDNLTTD